MGNGKPLKTVHQIFLVRHAPKPKLGENENGSWSNVMRGQTPLEEFLNLQKPDC
jgi:hypothetical protein